VVTGEVPPCSHRTNHGHWEADRFLLSSAARPPMVLTITAFPSTPIASATTRPAPMIKDPKYMFRKASYIISIATIVLLTTIGANALAVEPAASTVNAKYVDASKTGRLKPGEKIKNLFEMNMKNPFVLQRLTDRTYFVQVENYGATFYVGDKGVLLFDPLGGHGQAILAAIKEVTLLPVTAMVYSHNHADHIGDGKVIADAAKKAGVKLRIIATKKTASKMEFTKAPFPKPTETISWPMGHFVFEKLTVKIYGFERAAHTDDSSAWLLTNEKVLHLPDLVNPDQPPFRRFSEAENFLYFEHNMEEMGKLDWTFLNGGHGNVGSKEDLEFYSTFIADLKAEVGKAMADTPFGSGVDVSKINNHTVLVATWTQTISKKTTDALRSKYGKLYGFEDSTPSNAEMVALNMMFYPSGK
jgi:glyoxylase-like metal-dependent hydrolase (beta-lactamase superfamily II)